MKYLTQNLIKFFLMVSVIITIVAFLKVIGIDLPFILGIAFSFQMLFGLLIMKKYRVKIYKHIVK